MGRGSYIGFFVDWFIQAIACTSDFVVIILNASLFVGICFYINAMVTDMQMRTMPMKKKPNNRGWTLEPPESLSQKDAWSIYVEEIEFHNEIIEYFTFFPCLPSLISSFRQLN